MDDGVPRVIACEARGFPFDLHVDVEAYGLVQQLFAALDRRGGEPQAVFSVGRAGEERRLWQVGVGGRPVMASEHRGEALHALLVAINARVMAARPDLLHIHAAGVATPHGALLLPGDSGSGKTTLCARLLQLGACYLSDDSVALDRHGRLLGYAKPLSFKAGTWQQFAVDLADLDLDRELQHVWQVPPGRLGATSVASAHPAAVVVPRFEPGAPVRVEPLARAAGAVALLAQAQNLQAFGIVPALDIIGQAAASVSVHAAVYGDSREAAPAVLELAGMAPGGAAPYAVIPPIPAGGSTTHPSRAPDYGALTFEDGGVLVHCVSGRFALVDRIGAVIWSMLDGQRTVASVSAELAVSFAAPPAQVESDVVRWVTELAENGFLQMPAAAPGSP